MAWVHTIHKRWKAIMRSRRNWRDTQRRERIRRQRQYWFAEGGLKRFLSSTLGKNAPPVTIRSAVIQDDGGARYNEQREEVQAELIKLLDNWIPPGKN